MKKIFSRTSFFWLVNLIFMGVSVLHAGDFFGITGKDEFARYLGFAVSFFLDLVTIILMQAMLEARYRGEEHRARQFLFFIVLCCGTSTFANLAISLNDFEPTRYLPHAPLWVQVATPYILASFPLFVIMMSIAAEMIINVRPLEQLDEEEYEADEKKRLNLMTIRNDYLQKQAEQDLRLLEIRATMKANKMLYRPVFSLPWQRQPPPPVAHPVDVAAIKDSLKNDIMGEMKESYDIQIESLKRLVDDVVTDRDSLESVFHQAYHQDPIDAACEFDSFVMGSEHFVNDSDSGSVNESVNDMVYCNQTPKPKITIKLPNTDDLSDVNKLVRKSKPSGSVAAKKIQRLLKKNPNMGPTEIAEKVGVTKGYASQIKTQFLASTSEPA